LQGHEIEEGVGDGGRESWRGCCVHCITDPCLRSSILLTACVILQPAALSLPQTPSPPPCTDMLLLPVCR
jgi:hypothetical protein